MITVNGTGSLPGMITAFFEWSSGSYPSLTQIAASLQGTSNALALPQEPGQHTYLYNRMEIQDRFKSNPQPQ
jgi:hypothetical protein